jgi:Tol biopolymer transport system component
MTCGLNLSGRRLQHPPSPATRPLSSVTGGWWGGSAAHAIRLMVGAAVTVVVAVVVLHHADASGTSVTRTSSGMNLSTHSHSLPDGVIAYVSSPLPRSRRRGLVVTNPNGTGQRRLVACPTAICVISQLGWSPDGKRLAFAMATGRSAFAAPDISDLPLYVINADGSGQRPLAGCSRDLPCNIDPGFGFAWSPDSSRLVFPRRGSAQPEALYIMNVNTGRRRLLTQCTPRPSPFCSMPAWSPDGSKIAFAKNGLVYVVSEDGSGRKPLTPTRLAATPRFVRRARRDHRRRPEWTDSGGSRLATGRTAGHRCEPDLHVCLDAGTRRKGADRRGRDDRLPLSVRKRNPPAGVTYRGPDGGSKWTALSRTGLPLHGQRHHQWSERPKDLVRDRSRGQ